MRLSVTSSQYAKRNPYHLPFSLVSVAVRVQNYRCSFLRLAAGGHLKATTVLYTAEIELRPTVGGAIGRKFDPETGTGFWDFKE